MSKRSKAAKRAAKAAAKATGSVPGGKAGAEFRASNGRATLDDADFLTRVRREVNGMDGYSGGYRRNGNRSGAGSGYSWWEENRKFNERANPVSTHLLPIAKDEGIFCVESNEITKDCPLNPKVPQILVDTKIWDTWLKATKLYDCEWIALLFGRESITSKNDPCYVIDGYYFPPQTASGTHVEVPTGVVPRPGVIGAIHSHVGMSVFFSATDKAHSNWPVEIVINRRHEYEAVSRYKLKCGEWAKSKATVYLTGDAAAKEVNLELEAAFKLGDELEKRAKSKVAIVPSPASTCPYTPAPQPTQPIQETLALTVPSSDDGPSGDILGDTVNGGPLDELIGEYSCVNCEGDGWVDVLIGGITSMIECTTCGGSGLNAKGLDLQANLVKGDFKGDKNKGEGVVQ